MRVWRWLFQAGLTAWPYLRLWRGGAEQVRHSLAAPMLLQPALYKYGYEGSHRLSLSSVWEMEERLRWAHGGWSGQCASSRVLLNFEQPSYD